MPRTRLASVGHTEIFQMDIHNSPRFGEYVRIWPGASDNEVGVLAIDRFFEQLVLRVREPQRPFVQAIGRERGRSDAQIEADVRAAGGRVLDTKRDAYTVEIWTPAEERRFLCGRDDLRLFVVQVEGATTVQEAHRAMKPRPVLEAEARRAGSVLRQGEWFFVPLVEEDRASLESPMGALKPNRAVGRREGNRPHVAEEVLSIPQPPRRGELTLARGVVRHPDHHPLVLPELRRVLPNQAVHRPMQDRLRLRWID